MQVQNFTPRDVIQRGSIQKTSELQGLIDLVSSRPLDTVLEIGSYKGASLWMWCQLASPDALIISVDLPGGDFGGGYTPEEERVIQSYAQPGQTLELIRGDSHHMAIKNAVLRTLIQNDFRISLDLLFIDGDHTLEGVTKDWEMYSPLVQDGGLVVFHDIVDHSETFPTCQVKPLWDELKKGHEFYEFIDSTDSGVMPQVGPQWGGIGVLVK